MGAPAVTYFCQNGHILADIPHGYVDYNADKKICICGAGYGFSFMEWGDPEYCERCYKEGNHMRCEHKTRLIGNDKIEVHDACDPPCTYYVLLPKYVGT